MQRMGVLDLRAYLAMVIFDPVRDLRLCGIGLARLRRLSARGFSTLRLWAPPKP